mmetsp:Transcript_22507/g.67493  ORF Transcript_22507/g.67493 Transcript_22507/m.67493 type:complete len:650 (+) Transcript_22507:225-2174(+)
MANAFHLHAVPRRLRRGGSGCLEEAAHGVAREGLVGAARARLGAALPVRVRPPVRAGRGLTIDAAAEGEPVMGALDHDLSSRLGGVRHHFVFPQVRGARGVAIGALAEIAGAPRAVLVGGHGGHPPVAAAVPLLAGTHAAAHDLRPGWALGAGIPAVPHVLRPGALDGDIRDLLVHAIHVDVREVEVPDRARARLPSLQRRVDAPLLRRRAPVRGIGLPLQAAAERHAARVGARHGRLLPEALVLLREIHHGVVLRVRVAARHLLAVLAQVGLQGLPFGGHVLLELGLGQKRADLRQIVGERGGVYARVLDPLVNVVFERRGSPDGPGVHVIALFLELLGLLDFGIGVILDAHFDHERSLGRVVHVDVHVPVLRLAGLGIIALYAILGAHDHAGNVVRAEVVNQVPILVATLRRNILALGQGLDDFAEVIGDGREVGLELEGPVPRRARGGRRRVGVVELVGLAERRLEPCGSRERADRKVAGHLRRHVEGDLHGMGPLDVPHAGLEAARWVIGGVGDAVGQCVAPVRRQPVLRLRLRADHDALDAGVRAGARPVVRVAPDDVVAAAEDADVLEGPRVLPRAVAGFGGRVGGPTELQRADLLVRAALAVLARGLRQARLAREAQGPQQGSGRGPAARVGHGANSAPTGR